MSRDTQFLEKVISGAVSEPSPPSLRNVFGFVLGLRIARCARRMRSATSAGSKIGLPNGTVLTGTGCPCASVSRRRLTVHFQGLEEWESRHSVGHLLWKCVNAL